MCQLLAMNCNVPTDIVFSFTGFRKRGGLTDTHTDGFGMAFFEDKGVRIFRDNKPCLSSPIAELVNTLPIKSTNILSHIRRATQGSVSLVNTHPFIRELWGEYWVFAHNGNLVNFISEPGDFYNSVGDSDSEQAFCFILETLRKKFREKPTLEELFKEITEITKKISSYGTFNYILSNGSWLITHADTLLYYIVRQAPFSTASLSDDELSIDFASVTTEEDKVVVVTTIPLTNNEKWQQFAVNETILFQDGDIVLQNKPNNPRYLTIEEALSKVKI